jgi:methylenetetrahydrofolate reductase (NADPH)
MTTSDAASPQRTGQSMADVFGSIGYEVLPFKSAEQKVLDFVPKTTRMTVTASPGKGIDVTIDLAVKLAGHGYTVAPHLSAHMIRDKAELSDIVDRLREAKITTVFVVGGDADQVGEFSEALQVLQALDEIGHEFTDVGIGGYPEGHAAISDDVLMKALIDKSKFANHITTQICFDARLISSWADEIKRRGVDLPVRVGVPGAVSRQKLMRIAAATGLGNSARFLKKQQNMLWRFFLPGGYSPDKLINGLTSSFASSESLITGLHVFTFNDLDKTEIWRQKMAQRHGG